MSVRPGVFSLKKSEEQARQKSNHNKLRTKARMTTTMMGGSSTQEGTNNGGFQLKETVDNFNKELFNQVPLQYLASMLGIASETLSRLRKKASL